MKILGRRSDPDLLGKITVIRHGEKMQVRCIDVQDGDRTETNQRIVSVGSAEYEISHPTPGSVLYMRQPVLQKLWNWLV